MRQKLLVAILAVASLALTLYAFNLHSRLTEVAEREAAAVSAKAATETAAKQTEKKVSDLEAALEKARELAERNAWGPDAFRQAASFEVDDEVRNFVELEAGGREAYIGMIGGDLYSPYTWRVRHFKPGETNETQIRFTW